METPADPAGGHLIDRHADLDIRAVRLAGLRPGQKTRQCPSMIAGAVAVGTAFVLGQSAEHERPILDLGQRFQNVGELEIDALGLWRPVGHVHAVGCVHERHPGWRVLGLLASQRQGRLHGVQ